MGRTSKKPLISASLIVCYIIVIFVYSIATWYIEPLNAFVDKYVRGNDSLIEFLIVHLAEFIVTALVAVGLDALVRKLFR